MRRIRNGAISLLEAWVVLGLTGLAARGEQSVILEWNPSSSTNVAGYTLHYGVVSRQYTNQIDAGNATSKAVSGLSDGVTYFFTVSAYTADGLHSAYANEITVPDPSSPTNTAPVVNAGSDSTITLPGLASLCGTASDDGSPNPPGACTTSWTVVSGPGPVTFGNASATNTSASFTTVGTYVLRLTASDGALASSDRVTITVQTAVSRLTIQTNLFGTVSPDLNGSELVVGQTYELVATPVPGKVFAGWSGDVEGSAERLSFVMQSNMVVRANFTAHPFAGSYNGLFYEADEVRNHSSGFFSASVGTNGVFSAAVNLRGSNYVLSGQFDAEGRTEQTVQRPGTNSLVVTLQLDLQNGSDQLTGQITDGTWLALLLADRAIRDATADYGAHKGTYTLSIPGGAAPSDGPQGAGFGTVKVSQKGRATMVGEAADGKPITHIAWLSRNGEWPLYVPLYGGKGSMLGWITFTNRPTEDLSGTLSWIKPTKPLTRFYPGGFTNETVVTGSRFQVTQPLCATNVTVVMGAGNLSAVFEKPTTLAGTNLVTQGGGNRLICGINPSSGVFTGSFTDPGTGITNRLRGVVLQKVNRGAGYLRGTNQIGYVLLEPAP